MASKIFDFHFHLLFKHYLNGKLAIDQPFATNGLIKVLNDIFGGPFDSQASPNMVANSQLYLGVCSVISLEHAFANRILHVLGLDLSPLLPINKDLVTATKNGETTYFREFSKQTKYYLDNAPALDSTFNIVYIGRNTFKDKTADEIKTILTKGDKRYLAFAMEGGHNLSDVPILGGSGMSLTPDLNLKAIQDGKDVFEGIDFMSMNLCHLSFIREQPLGGFCQGLNKQAQIAFSSEDFAPKKGLGLTASGKAVIRQALTHATRPIVIDVKHMSVYTRFHYYRFREALIDENPDVARLPIISSHTGFTFRSLAQYLQDKTFTTATTVDGGQTLFTVASANVAIGKTNDKINSGLFGNPWTINLFDEEIVQLMQSGGMIGISLDQRILGAEKMLDSSRDDFFDAECIAEEEWTRLFQQGQLPGREGLLDFLRNVAPSRAERHVMLLCTHLVYAVRVGLEQLPWDAGTSPWDHLCIGSDFDGLINPINRLDNIQKLHEVEADLLRYLPIADKYLQTGDSSGSQPRSLQYDANGAVDKNFLQEVVQKFLWGNGLDFMIRYLQNWKQ